MTAQPQQCQAEHRAVSTAMLLDVQEMCRKLLLTRCGTAVEGFQKVVSSGTSCKTRDNLLPMVCSLFFLKKNPTQHHFATVIQTWSGFRQSRGMLPAMKAGRC